MKKILLALLLLSSFPGVAMAVVGGDAPTNSGYYEIPLPSLLGNATLKDLIDRVSSFALGLLIAMSVLFIIYAAYLFMFAGENPANVQKAKNIILYTVIGIVVGLMAKVILNVVIEVLGGKV
jgi:hypothetical protein